MINFKKSLYSSNFRIALEFFAKGGISGEITWANGDQDEVSDVTGLYVCEDERMYFSFFCLIYGGTTCFSGECPAGIDVDGDVLLRYSHQTESGFCDVNEIVMIDRSINEYTPEK